MFPGAKLAHGSTTMPGAARRAESNEFGKKPNIAVDKDLLRHSSLSYSSSVLCFEELGFSAARFAPHVKAGYLLALEERCRWLPCSPTLRIMDKALVVYNMYTDGMLAGGASCLLHPDSKVLFAGVLHLSLRHARLF